MGLIINNLPPVIYFGKHKDLIQHPDINLQSRLIALDYENDCEVFVNQLEMFKSFDLSVPYEILSVKTEKGRNIAEYSGYLIDHYRNDINEKTTQWVSLAINTLKAAGEFQEQIKRQQGNRFSFNAPLRVLESSIENYCFQLISILDLYASLSKVFNRKAPSKFGQQISNTRKGLLWDKEYQEFFMKHEALLILRDYRNLFGHEASLKLRPTRINQEWIAVIIGKYEDNRGLNLLVFLNQVKEEFLAFTDFFEKHFSTKCKLLGKLAIENEL